MSIRSVLLCLALLCVVGLPTACAPPCYLPPIEEGEGETPEGEGEAAPVEEGEGETPEGEGEAPPVEEGEGGPAPEGEVEGSPAPEGEGEAAPVEEGEGESPGGEGDPEPPLSSGVDCVGDCGFEIRNVYPHNRDAFTQGLDFYSGHLYEGTGLECCTTLRKVNLETGVVLKNLTVPEDFCTSQRFTGCGGRSRPCLQFAQVFGEGIAIFGNEIIQLTWKDCVGFVYDRDTFAFKRSFSYEHEGWGITHDGQRLIVSDGSDTLRFWDPYTYLEIGQVKVQYQGNPISRLNELEFVNGSVFANVWPTNYIVRIDPETGNVLTRVNLEGLLPESDRQLDTDVLNGIAYDPDRDRLFVTGKKWPKLYEIALIPAR